MNKETLLLDIPEEIAKRAYQGTSHDPDKKGDNIRIEYAEMLLSDYQELLKLAKNEELQAILAEKWQVYRVKYAVKFIHYLQINSGCYSTMITGPSNFNHRQAEKRSNSADKALKEATDYRDNALKSLKKALQPEN